MCVYMKPGTAENDRLRSQDVEHVVHRDAGPVAHAPVAHVIEWNMIATVAMR